MDPKSDDQKKRRHDFAEILYEKRQRKGVTLTAAKDMMQHRNYFSPMLVESGYADAMISGLTRNYPDTLKPALQVIGKKPNANIVSGMYIINTKEGPIFFADCTVNKNPDVDTLVEITTQTTYAVEQFKIKPRVAFMSYSNFGSNDGGIPKKQRLAVAKLHKSYPDMVVDGEMQANVALNAEMIKENFPFSKLADGPANTLIFPYLTAGNVAYKLMQEMGNYEVIGPVMNGMNKSVHVLNMGSSVSDIVNMVMISVVDAQCAEKRMNDEKC